MLGCSALYATRSCLLQTRTLVLVRGTYAHSSLARRLTMTDIGDQESLQTFYHLLTAILQIVNSIVLTKGARNDHVLAQGRQFLGENRQCMQAIFKSTTRVDARVPAAMKQSLSDLVDYFSLLITTTGFLEVCPDEWSEI